MGILILNKPLLRIIFKFLLFFYFFTPEQEFFVISMCAYLLHHQPECKPFSSHLPRCCGIPCGIPASILSPLTHLTTASFLNHLFGYIIDLLKHFYESQVPRRSFLSLLCNVLCQLDPNIAF